MSKSPRRVLQVAYDAARQAVPAHRHRFSPKKFTRPQLLACLVLEEFLRLDYRGLVEHLADHGELTRLLALEVIPHYTTLQKAAARLLKAAPAASCSTPYSTWPCGRRSAGAGSPRRP